MGRVSRSGGAEGASGVAAEELRRHNLAAVLEHLHLHGPANRSQLTAITGLNRSTVADLVGELVQLGIVAEAPGVSVSGPGRPSPVVHPNPDGAVVLAVEMSVDSIAVATIGLGGHLYDEIRVARERGHSDPQAAVRDSVELAQPLLAGLPSGHRLVGIGVAVVGIVRRRDGFVHIAPNLGWRDLPLGQLITDEMRLDVPVGVANEADLGALGEHRRGGRSSASHLVFVSGEVGIGCGLVVGGTPLLGAAGYAGEAGHTMVNPDGQMCSCGARGCWETEAGEKALLNRVAAVGSTGGLEAIEVVARLAAEGDDATLRAISETGIWLGLGIANLVNLLNPDVIVLGGLYHRLFDYLEASVLEGAGRALQASQDMAEIRRSNIGANAPLIGAAELAMECVIDDPAHLASL